MSAIAKYILDSARIDYEALGKAQHAQQVELAGKYYHGYKNDPPLNPQQPYVHGAGGLLSSPGQNPALFSNIVHPIPGMASRMPVLPEPIVEPDYGGADVPLITTIVGVTEGDDDTDDQPAAYCADCSIAGLLKACTRTSPFGNFCKATREINFDRVGHYNNRGETLDFRLQNSASTEDPLSPSEVHQGAGDWINSEWLTRIYEAGIGFQRMMLPLVYTSNPVNNNGARQFFSGFDLQINTGIVDFFTQVACPGMDSLIGSFANTDITAADANGSYIFQHLEHFMRYLRSSARKMALDPVKWVIAMREDLFWELTEIIPIQQYVELIAMANAINAAAVGPINMNANVERDARYDMRNNYWLPLDGKRVEVVVDDGIAEAATAVNNQYTSDIYFIPMTVMGNIPVTYWQFFQFDNTQARQLMQMVGGQIQITDGGKVWWATNHKNGCIQANWHIRPRLMHHTPFLAARLEDVAYTPGIHSRSPFPDDANYYDGGRTNAPPESGYPDWSPTTEVDVGVIE